MFTCQTPPRALARAISLALGITSLPVMAIDYTWVGGSGDWDTASNWDLLGIPQSGDTALLTGSDVDITYNSPSPQHLTLLTVRDYSNLFLLGSSMNVDTLVAGSSNEYSYGGIYQSGGTLTATDLQLGLDAGTGGRFVWTGGSLDVDNIHVGVAGSGTFIMDVDQFDQHDSWLEPVQNLIIGEQAGSSGYVEQHNGQIGVIYGYEDGGSQIIVGEAGNAYYLGLGGVTNSYETVIGHMADSEGTYEMWGSAHYSVRTVVGDAGVGHFILNYGEFSSDELVVGRGAGGVGDFQLNGGYQSFYAGSIVIGQDAGSQGTFSYTGGDLDSHHIIVGKSGTGTLILDGGNLDVDNTNAYEYGDGLVVGELAGSEGLVEQYSSDLNVNGPLLIGVFGNGTYKQYTGVHAADQTILGFRAGSVGTYELMDGLHITASETVGFEGTGHYIQTGGGHSSQEIYVGTDDGAGYYDMSGGNLSVGSLYLTNGEFNWTGGQINVESLFVSNNGTFIQDIGSGNDYILQSGQSILIGTGSESGLYEQRSGNISSNSDYARIVIGSGGDGTYRQYDGTYLANETLIGQESFYDMGVGTYELIGDTAVYSAQRTVVGDTGIGHFVQTAGVNESLELIIGRDGEGDYQFSGGELNTQSIILGELATINGKFTHRGQGAFTWSGGNLNFTDLHIGKAGYGTFTQDIGTGNELVLASDQTIIIGEQSGSSGGFVQQSGDVDSHNSPIVIAEAGRGSYDQLDGVHYAGETVIGHLSGSEGWYSLTGAAAHHVTTRTVVGDAGYGGYWQSAGQHDADELILAQSSGSYGYYDFYGGSLNTTTTQISTAVGGTGVMRIYGSEAAWNNTGTIYVGADLFAAQSTGSGLLELRDGAMISSSAVIVGENGTVKGMGSIQADITNKGVFTPGTLGLNLGQLDIDGNYTQLDEGALSIEVSGYDFGLNHDLLNIFGDANLDGTLNVSLYGNYTFSLGDSFDILYANMIYGNFDSLLFPIFNGMTFDIAYDLNTVRLTVVSAVPVPAAAWLFGSGVVALMGIARRRKAA